MPTPVRIDPSAATPIWSQIEEQVRRLVATGSLAPGSPVPSVRDLARDLTVNPATVSKAYQRLVAQGLLEVRRGDGTYVAETSPSVAPGHREREVRAHAETFCLASLQLGATEDEAIAQVRAAWSRLDRGTTGAGTRPRRSR